MSIVLNFFKEHPSWDDGLHKILAKIPGYEAQLIPLRQAALGCCGAAPGKNGEIKLTVVDVQRWDALMAEQAIVISKLDAINRAVAELDKIFTEVEQAGFNITDKTPRALWDAAPRVDPPPQRGELLNQFGKRVDQNGIPLKSRIDPRFLSWDERAQKAMRGL
jgi:hypothetical protein